MTLLVKNPIDAYVGAQIKQRRSVVGMSQTELANHLGITFQQVQKYENGFNRVSASRLYEIAELLDVPLSSFFEGVEEVIKKKNKKKADKKTQDKAFVKAEEFAKTPKGIDAIKALASIKDPDVFKTIVALVKSIAAVKS